MIVDLKAGHPVFRLGEITQIGFVASWHRPSPHTIQRIHATGPEPKVVPRQLFDTQYRSPQLLLWDLGDGVWGKVVRMPQALPDTNETLQASNEYFRQAT